MQIHNVYYDVNISGLKLINQDFKNIILALQT